MTRSQLTRVIIYCRISSDDERDSLGVERQEHECRLHAERQGWEVVGVYVDNDKRASGAPLWRPEWERFREEIRAGEACDAVLAWELERFTRRPKELEEFVEDCQGGGVGSIDTVADRIDTGSGDGLLMARVKGAFGAEEAAKIGRRVRAKKDELARDGKPAGGGPRAFGYSVDYMTLVPAEAEMLRDAAARVLDGETVNSICAGWNAAGKRTTTGRHWMPSTLRTTLKSGRIAGLREHHGIVVRAAVWPAIIDTATRDRLVAALAPRGRRVGVQARGQHLLTGLLFCGRDGCDGRVVSTCNNGSRSYGCRGMIGRPDSGCNRLSIMAEPLEAVVVEMALDALEGGLLDALKAQRSGAADPADIARAAELEARLDDLVDMLGLGEIDRPGFVRARTVANDELDVVVRRVQRMQTRSLIDGFLDGAGAVPARWEAATLPEKRAVLASLFESITIAPAVRGRPRFDPDRVEPTWRF